MKRGFRDASTPSDLDSDPETTRTRQRRRTQRPSYFDDYEDPSLAKGADLRAPRRRRVPPADVNSGGILDLPALSSPGSRRGRAAARIQKPLSGAFGSFAFGTPGMAANASKSAPTPAPAPPTGVPLPTSTDGSKQGSARFDDGELKKLGEHRNKGYRPKTLNDYRSQFKKFEWFINFAHNNPLAQKWSEAAQGRPLPEVSMDLSTPDGPDKAARSILWFMADCPGFYEAKGAAKHESNYSLLKSYLSALQKYYSDCKLANKDGVDRKEKLRSYPVVEAAISGFSGQAEKGAVDLYAAADPQENTINDVYSSEEFKNMCYTALEKTHPRDATGLCGLTIGMSTLSRSDDMRLFRLCCLGAPREQENIGPLRCHTVPILIAGAKRLSGRTRDYKLLVRDKRPWACALGALGRNFMMRFTLQKEPFPNPLDPVVWRSNMLLSNDVSSAPLEYKTQYAFIDALYEEVGVIVKGKTHGPRRAGARILEERGLSLDKIARIGGWDNSVVEKIYLAGYSSDMILAMGGWPGAAQGDVNQYWDERFLMALPMEILLYMYPFLPELKARILEALEAGQSVKSAISVYETLHFLAAVVYQDALELVPLTTTSEHGPVNPCHQKLLAHPLFVEKLMEYQELKRSGALALFHRPVTVQDQLAAMQQHMGQLEKLMLALKNTGMDDESALLEAKQQAEDMRLLQAQNNHVGVIREVDEVMGEILGEVEGPNDVPSAVPASPATLASDPEHAMQGVLSLSPHLQPLISPSKRQRAVTAAAAAAPSLRRVIEHQGPLSPTMLPAPTLGLAPQGLHPAQQAVLQKNAAHLAPRPSALPAQAALLRRFDTVPLDLVSHRPQTSASASKAINGTGHMISFDGSQWSGAGVTQVQVAPQPVGTGMLAGFQGLTLPAPAAPSLMPAGATGGADGLITMPLAALQQLLAISAGGGSQSVAIGQHFSSGNKTSGSGGSGGGSGGGMNVLFQNSSGSRVVEGERILPQLSKWHSIKDLVEWLHKPPLGQSGPTIAQREWEWKQHGWKGPDISWRQDGNKSTRKRFSEYKKVYDKVQAVKEQMNRTRRFVGGIMSDIDVAEKLDQERGSMEVCTWVKRLCQVTAQPKAKKVVVEEEVDEIEQVAGSAASQQEQE